MSWLLATPLVRLRGITKTFGVYARWTPCRSTPSTASPCRCTQETGGISPLGFPGVPQTPILFYHSTNDELAPIGEMQQLAARFCGEGVTVHVETSPVGEHIAYVLVGFPTGLDYIADRFAGQPAPDDCQPAGGGT